MTDFFFQLLGVVGIVPLLFLILSIPSLLVTVSTDRSIGRQVAGWESQNSVVLISLSLLILFFPFLSNSSIGHQALIAFPYVVSLEILFLLFSYLPNQFRSGNCLLDLGKTGWSKSQVISSLFILLVMAYLFVTTEKGRSLPNGFLVMNCLLAVYFLIQGLIPLQVREQGILGLTFIKWDNILDYYWESDRQTILTVTRKNLFGFNQKTSFSIPPIHKDKLVKILVEKASPAKPG